MFRQRIFRGSWQCLRPLGSWRSPDLLFSVRFLERGSCLASPRSTSMAGSFRLPGRGAEPHRTMCASDFMTWMQPASDSRPLGSLRSEAVLLEAKHGSMAQQTSWSSFSPQSLVDPICEGPLAGAYSNPGTQEAVARLHALGTSSNDACRWSRRDAG